MREKKSEVASVCEMMGVVVGGHNQVLACIPANPEECVWDEVEVARYIALELGRPGFKPCLLSVCVTLP